MHSKMLNVLIFSADKVYAGNITLHHSATDAEIEAAVDSYASAWDLDLESDYFHEVERVQ